jgi:hypothetical protein
MLFPEMMLPEEELTRRQIPPVWFAMLFPEMML